MATTVKNMNVALTKGDVHRIEQLMEHFGETRSDIVKRALSSLYYETFTNGYFEQKSKTIKND
jgi:hypothetical protein